MVQRLLFLALTVLLCAATAAQEGASLRGGNDSGAELTFIGSATRLSVGVDSDGDPVGEFFQVFGEQPDSAWIGEGWLSDGDGGLKLNYHWLAGDGASAEAIGKAFLAWDRNEDHDSKLTLGGGFERQDWFFGAYLSRSLTGRRLAGSSQSSVTDTINGVEEGREFIQVRTTTTLTRVFEHPYDYGLGFRSGWFMDGQLLRLYGGLDYEWGDHDADQITLALGAEKFFAGSPFSLALEVEGLRKSGDFEDDEDDLRGLVLVRYDFGRSHRPAREYRRVQAAAPPAAEQVVKNDIDLEAQALFAFDSADLAPAARQILADLAGRLNEARVLGEINVVGHTDSIGGEPYNQRLSLRRARAVAEFLAAGGLPAERLRVQGRGESEPVASNATPEGRQRNRRVVVQALTAAPMAAPPPEVEWRQELVAVPPAWINRGLRHPVPHKRTVDVYRIEEQETTVSLGERTFLNRVPVAAADSITVDQGSGAVLIDVLANDADPDQDRLTVVAVTRPANGTAAAFGDAVTYTPGPGFSGVDSFSYTVADGQGGESSATVTVTVRPANRPPVAVDDDVQVPLDTPVVIDVLANDSDPDGDPLTIIDASDRSVMMSLVVVNADGTIRYQPKAGWFGDDSFTYTISDGRGGTDSATVRVVVSP